MEGKVAVFFCSASFDIDPKYNQAAREYVRAACLRGYTISSGGTTKGTMKVVVDTARECGARTKGVLPRFMTEVVHPELDELIWTDTMAERKERLRDDATVVVALPGGIGTLDEYFETLTLAKLGVFRGKVIAVNAFGFYDKLKELLDFYVETGMLDAQTRSMAYFVDTVEAFEALL
jgi:uncharacterized protein (TIGR00730 family)